MASPQLEDGHIRIANELYDAILLHPFTKREVLVVMSILRKTYGYKGAKSAEISHYQIAAMTGIRRESVAETVRGLQLRNVVHVRILGTSPQGYELKEMGVNKDYESWDKPVDKAVDNSKNAKHVRTQNKGVGSTQNASVSCTQNDTQVNTEKQKNNTRARARKGAAQKNHYPRTDDQWCEYGKREGLTAKPGESMPAYVSRLRKHHQQRSVTTV